MSKETPVKSVTGSFKKKTKRNNVYHPFVSDKSTAPYNDVTRVVENNGVKEFITIKGLTEEEKIAEGTRPALAWAPELKEDGTPKLNKKGQPFGRFQKTKWERNELHIMKSGCVNLETSGSGGGIRSDSKRRQKSATLVVHLANFNRKFDRKDFKAEPVSANPVGFKTTYSFPNVKESEINTVLSTIIRLNYKDPKDEVLNYVLKYYFDGETYLGKAKPTKKA